MSNKKIVRSSVIIDEKFRQANDSIMADCRFTIAKELEKIKIEPKNPCFLWCRIKLIKAEVKESQRTASVWIHVERAISRM